jgi:membrane-bound metal-dependent hydrolase YbcI (DUF457 family)
VNAGTHIAFAGLCGVIAQGFGYTLEPAGLLALGVGSVLPDVDTSTSVIGQSFPSLSRWLERRFGHRTITHSLLGVLILASISSPLFFWHSSVFAFLLLGFVSHLILDTFNISGVPLLWPSRIVFWFFPHRAYRVAYNSPLERLIAFSCVVTALAFIPFSSVGFSNSFHKFLGTPSGVVSDYLEWRDQFEVFAEVDGFNVETQEKIHGRYRVVDAIGKEGVIVEDEAGDALGMGLARGAQVSVYHVAAFKSQPIQTKEYRLEFESEPLEQLLSRLPKANRVWITANLQTRDRIEPAPPKVGRYPRVRAFGKTLEVRSARPSDLEGLQDAMIEHGSAVIRAEFTDEPAANLEPVKRKPKTFTLEIPNLPTLAGLVIKPGDKVLEGQPIARYVNDAILEAHQLLVEKAVLTISQSKAELRSLNAVYSVQASSLSEKIARAKREVSRFEYLVNAGAEPPVKLAQARAGLTDLERTQLEALSQFTSKTASLECQVQEANLTVKGARAMKGVILEKQWLRSPLSGLVSEVRVKSVTGKGVSVEVVILEERSKPDSVPGP